MWNGSLWTALLRGDTAGRCSVSDTTGNYIKHKPPRHFAPCPLDFHTPRSSITLPTPSIYAYNYPIQLLYMPVLHYSYIQLYSLYRLCYPRRCLWRNVRPTSQCQAVSSAALFSAAPNCHWWRRHSRFFAWQHIFGQRNCSLIDDDDCALHDINTAWMPLWHHCDTTYLSVSWLELLCNLFLPIVQSYAVEEYDTLVTRFFRYRLLWCLSLSLLHICSILVVCVCTNSTVVISRAFPRPIFSHSAISRPGIWCVIFMNSIFSQPVRRSSADAI